MSTKVKDFDVLGHVSSMCNGVPEFTVGNIGRGEEAGSQVHVHGFRIPSVS